MIRWLEIPLFGLLAFGLHVAFAMTVAPEGSSDAGGQGGEALVTLKPADASVMAMVKRWETPVDAAIVETPQMQSPAVQIPLARPQLRADRPTALMPPARPPHEATANDDLRIDTTSASPPTPRTRPRPRPAPKPAARETMQSPSAPSANVPKQVAQGVGATNQAGVTKTAAIKTLGAAQERHLMATWGGKIRSKIERNKRFPKGATGTGRVVIRITVSSGGALLKAQMVKPSGQAAFDEAAMTAVLHSKKLPKAPAELAPQNYTFNLPIDYR